MPEKLNDFEKEILLKFFLFHMTMELRNIFMHTFPTIYNKLFGDIMEVRNTKQD